MSIKDLKKTTMKKPSVKDIAPVAATPAAPAKTSSRKAEEDKLKHQAIVRFTDKELAKMESLGLLRKGKIDNRELRDFIVSKL